MMSFNINIFFTKKLVLFFSLLFILCWNAMGQVKLNNQQKNDILEMFISNGDLQEDYRSKYLNGFEGLTSFTIVNSIQCHDQKIEFYCVRLNTSHSLTHVYVKTRDKYLCLPIAPEANLLRPLFSLFNFYIQNGCEIDKEEVLKKISSVYLENTINRSRTTIYPLER